jgi:hypothetical protein
MNTAYPESSIKYPASSITFGLLLTVGERKFL